MANNTDILANNRTTEVPNTSALAIPTAQLEAVNFTGVVKLKRLRINLDNLITGKGTSQVITRRYLYLYQDAPNTLFLSTQALRGMERGIKAYSLEYWSAEGLTELQYPLTKEEETELNHAMEGLEPKDLFQALSGAHPLPVLLVMGYVTSDCLSQSFGIINTLKETNISAVIEGRKVNLTDEELRSMGFNPDNVGTSTIKYASSPAPESEHDTTDRSAYTETPRDKPAAILSQPPASKATLDIAPKAETETPKGWASVDWAPEGELSIVTDNGTVTVFKDASPVGESVSDTSSTVDSEELARLAALYANPKARK